MKVKGLGRVLCHTLTSITRVVAPEDNERPLDSSDARLEINPSVETQGSKRRFTIRVDLDTRVPIHVRKRSR